MAYLEAAAGKAADREAPHGSLTIDAAGAWTYEVDNALPEVQGLVEGQFLTDTVVVTSADGESCIVFDWSDKTFETLHDYKLHKTSATYPLDAPDRDEYFRESDPKYSPKGAFQMVWYILPASGDPLDGVFVSPLSFPASP